MAEAWKYTDRMVRCAISDGQHLSRDWTSAREHLLRSAQGWAADGVELIQLREKWLDAGPLLDLAEDVLRVVRREGSGATRLLVNGRADVAAAAGADGVHLTSAGGELSADQVRVVFARARRPDPLVSASCHSLNDVERAKAHRVDYILFGPVFEKRSRGELVVPGVGLEALRRACEAAGGIPVLALGGVTSENSGLCLAAGAAGIAGIRLFHECSG